MRSCVAVIGAGRSGTSLAMHLLSLAGLRLSTKLEPASKDNPDGHFEDVRIIRIQQALMNKMGLLPHLPRPNNWAMASNYSRSRKKLCNLLNEEVARDESTWGFKDPRTCITWPLWQEVFGLADVSPLPVFCTRDGGAVVGSMMTAYGLAQDHAEAIYLYRILHALEDVREGWYFVRYTDWFSEANRQMLGLSRYCGMRISEEQASAIVSANVRPKLNRQAPDSKPELSGILLELDDMLQSFAGTDYDQDRIDSWCSSVRSRLADFRYLVDGIRRIGGKST